jgi:hypothetical protein
MHEKVGEKSFRPFLSINQAKNLAINREGDYTLLVLIGFYPYQYETGQLMIKKY